MEKKHNFMVDREELKDVPVPLDMDAYEAAMDDIEEDSFIWEDSFFKDDEIIDILFGGFIEIDDENY